MKKTTTAVLIAGFALGAVSRAGAQVDAPKGYLEVNAGGQLPAHTLTTTATFPLYKETATVTGSETVGAGLSFDVGGGYRIKNSLAIGVDVSMFTRNADGTAFAALPDQFFFNRYSTVAVPTSSLKRTEYGGHFKVVYFRPVGDKLGLALSAGPSLIRFSQDIPSVTIAGGLQSATVEKQWGTAVGANAGMDLNYLLTSRYGTGAFVRYVFAKGDLPSASGVRVGGLQAGVGLRLLF